MELACRLLVALLATGAPMDGFSAASRAGPGPHIAIGIQVLEASTAPGATDGPSSRAARDLSATLNYKSYRTLSQEERLLAPDEWATITLPNGATLSLSPKAIDDKAHTVRLQVAIHQGKHHLETDYSVRDGGTVFVSAGASGKNVLILAIVPKAK